MGAPLFFHTGTLDPSLTIHALRASKASVESRSVELLRTLIVEVRPVTTKIFYAQTTRGGPVSRQSLTAEG